MTTRTDIAPILVTQSEAADEIERLRADMKQLEQLYNTDRVAQEWASQIETIFDRWLR